ncbi:TetR/AcrR family transcriptional regulator [Acetobacter okinawensis]|uniref:TetR/AcrR family transcriptional regulator n=1 Tax=Acetobacter okinawensis TaxID=1076594 RepID=UPI000A8A4DB9|nr:TetR/AcrR family transcriptional regulator [Acetobacter okinawensis]
MGQFPAVFGFPVAGGAGRIRQMPVWANSNGSGGFMADGVTHTGGRPSHEAAEELDRTIIAIATAQFMRAGYAATSVEHIAKVIGCSKATIYRRYPSKKELFRAVVHERCRDMVDILQAKPEGQANPMDAIKDMLRRFLDFLLVPETVETYRILIMDCQQFASITADLDRAIEPLHARMNSLLGQALGWADTPANRAEIAVLEMSLRGLFTGWPLHQMLSGHKPFATKAAERRFF